MQQASTRKQDMRRMLGLLTLTLSIVVSTSAQDSDPKLLSAPAFVLAEEVVAAGIDGTVRSVISIDDKGNVSQVRLFGDPLYPCGSKPKRELAAVRKAIEEHIRASKYSPAMKGGKPHEVEASLVFALGDAFRRAVAIQEAKKDPSARLVKAGVVNGRALRLVRPFATSGRGIASVQVLIDEQGNVVKAAGDGGNQLLVSSALDAACESKFSPTVIDGKTVQVTGVINYVFR